LFLQFFKILNLNAQFLKNRWKPDKLVRTIFAAGFVILPAALWSNLPCFHRRATQKSKENLNENSARFCPNNQQGEIEARLPMEVKCRRLEGKVAVVTASTQGIGLAIAQRLGLEGAAVVISSRKQVRPSLPAVVTSCLDSYASLLIRFLFLGPDLLQKNVDEAVEGLKAKGITAVGAVCHVSDAQQRKHLIDTAVKVRIGFSFFRLVTLSDAYFGISAGELSLPSGRCHGNWISYQWNWDWTKKKTKGVVRFIESNNWDWTNTLFF
jgi:hypothetical protein